MDSLPEPAIDWEAPDGPTEADRIWWAGQTIGYPESSYDPARALPDDDWPEDEILAARSNGGHLSEEPQ